MYFCLFQSYLAFFFLNQIINYISKITVKKKEMQVLLESFKKVFKNTDTV